MATTISAEETFHLRIANLLLQVAPTAVRVKNFANIVIQDKLPVSAVTTDAAALSTIKFYRNEIVHKHTGTFTEQEFHQIWKVLSQAIILLGGLVFTQLCADLKVCNLDSNYREILTELRNIRSKTIPEGVTVVHNSLLEEWYRIDEKVVQTKAIERIEEILKNEQVVTVIGPPGCGKSTSIHHVALLLHNEENYDILPVNSPEEIKLYYNSECKQMFVYDDICGKYAIDNQVLEVAHTDIIRDRFQLVSLKAEESKGIITVDPDKEEAYFDRISKDIRDGHLHNVFTNNQITNMSYQHKLFDYLKGNEVLLNQVLSFEKNLHHYLQLQIRDAFIFKNNNTPFHAACFFDNVKIVQILIDFECDPSVLSVYNESALFVACLQNSILSVGLLLEKGSNPNLYTNVGGNYNPHSDSDENDMETTSDTLQNDPDEYICALLLENAELYENFVQSSQWI
ncbi:unnamed protein product [Mytilus edulis]|uniref:DZIP3-like HEPN domain-containing protein n=1 Tax=Mytilus edulis TaxID=6550 RepID=A0A8S3TCT5_MYTED|nr:unnamed protein product [Mytilus edulis]